MILLIQTSSQAVSTLSKKIDFFLLFCSPAASLWAAASEALPQRASVPFALPCSAPSSAGPPAVGFHLLLSRSRVPVGPGPPTPQSPARQRSRNPGAVPRKPGSCGWHGCPCAAGDGHGGVKALSLALLKTRVAWFVCTGCSSSTGAYHTFSSCLQNAVITNCKNQPHPHLIRAKPAQLCTASPARPVC